MHNIHDNRTTTNLVKKHILNKYGLKISVKSESYSGGSSFNVKYKNGPDNSVIDAELSGLEYGTFDAMTDCAGVRHTTFILDGKECMKYKHVFVRQEIDKELKTAIAKAISDSMKFENVEAFTGDNLEDYQPRAHHLYRTWNDIVYQVQPLNLPPCENHEIEFTHAIRNGQHLEMFYIYDGVQYCTAYEYLSNFAPTTKGKTSTTPAPEPINTDENEIAFVEYSQYSFALTGKGTFAIKDELKKLGGKYNAFLKCGKGYIFSNKKREAVLNYLEQLSTETAPEEQQQDQTQPEAETPTPTPIVENCRVIALIPQHAASTQVEEVQTQPQTTNMFGQISMF